MYTVIRQYRTAPQLIEELLKHKEEIERLIRDVPGFVGYYLIQSGEGGASITVCEDQAGTQESTRRAAEWVREHLPDMHGSPPEVTEGETVLRFER